MSISRKDIANLPERAWAAEGIYDSILVVPSGKKHDSGFALMKIIGMNNLVPIEIAAWCDDICWKFPALMNEYGLRNDMFYPSNIIHFWSNMYRFKVGRSLSSTDIFLIKKDPK